MGYKIYGLEGLGVSYIIGYIFGLSITLLVAHKKYGFVYAKTTINAFMTSILLIIIVFVLVFFLDGFGRYFAGAIVLMASVLYSFIELDKRLRIRPVIIDIIRRVLPGKRS